ncbi:hypothetical protein EDC96DRAFT_577509 [Choanephora cucurbitarum]|nr:hypothetical protein EDC96DRAFT_577509 [Choanephora cucurbitarum]
MTLKACTSYANSQGSHGVCYTDVPVQGKSLMQRTALDLLLEAHEELQNLPSDNEKGQLVLMLAN